METLYKDYDEGEIRLLHIKSFDAALKLKWINYFHRENRNVLHILMSRNLQRISDIKWQTNICQRIKGLSSEHKTNLYRVSAIFGYK